MTSAPVEILQTASGVRFVRTPEERFAGLESYPFAPHYADIDGLRMHFVDEGPRGGHVVLLLHGQPTWSYLYRKMIPVLAAAGHRVVAPDHIGTGRSDKPVELGAHTYERHVQRVKDFIAALGLRDITLFCQDWGSLMGLRVAGDEPELFARIVVANGTLPVIPKGFNPFRVPEQTTINTANGTFADLQATQNPSDPQPLNFQKWIGWALTSDFRPSEVVERLTRSTLSPGAAAGYDAPYPSLEYKAAIRAFPSMIAAVEDQNVPAWEALGRFKRPFLSFAGELDRNLGSKENQQRLIGHIPGATGQPHDRFNAHHFIQEDIGEILAERVNDFISRNPIGSDA